MAATDIHGQPAAGMAPDMLLKGTGGALLSKSPIPRATHRTKELTHAALVRGSGPSPGFGWFSSERL